MTANFFEFNQRLRTIASEFKCTEKDNNTVEKQCVKDSKLLNSSDSSMKRQSESIEIKAVQPVNKGICVNAGIADVDERYISEVTKAVPLVKKLKKNAMNQDENNNKATRKLSKRPQGNNSLEGYCDGGISAINPAYKRSQSSNVSSAAHKKPRLNDSPSTSGQSGLAPGKQFTSTSISVEDAIKRVEKEKDEVKIELTPAEDVIARRLSRNGFKIGS